MTDMNNGSHPVRDPIFCNDAPLAMAEVAFNRGTFFRDLDLPFIGEEALPRG